MFESGEGKSLSSETPPRPVISKYARDGDKIFSENVDYQSLKGEAQTTVRVGVVVRKCAAEQCAFEEETVQEPKYTVRLCEFRLQ